MIRDPLVLYVWFLLHIGKGLIPQCGHQLCYGEKLPMAWGVPQQTSRHNKSIPFQYAIETKHLTIKDIESYLILDG